jgi:branched-chain amino acid transport system substrate-binding protein
MLRKERRYMRRILVIASLLVALVLGVSAQELTIGVNLSTTGPAASLGIPNKNSAMLAPSEIGGLKVKYIYLDDGSDPTTAVQNVKRLISENNIDILMGPSITPTSMAVLDTLQDAKLPAIVYGSTSQITSPQEGKRKWVFKTVPNDDVFVNALTTHMAKHGVKKLSMLAVNDSYGESWINAVKKAIGEKGITMLAIERFERSDTSTTPQALRLVKDNPDAILIAAVGTSAVTPHQSLVERHYKGKIYQSGGAVNPDFLRVGGKILEGSYAAQSPVIVANQLPNDYPTKKAAMEWLNLYTSKYGPPAPYAAYPWDTVKLLQAAVPVALKSAKPGTVQFREALRAALENVQGVVGAAAVYSMSPNDHVGINDLGMSVLKVQNGTWALEQVADYKKMMKK